MADHGDDSARGRVGLCACGCGRLTWVATRTQRALGHVKGQPVRFIRGHATKGRKLALHRHQGTMDGGIETGTSTAQAVVWDGTD